LLLDEPFSGLDPINTQLFEEAIRDFQKQGSMIVFSSHQLDYVESFCEQIVILERGHVVISGHINDIKRDFKRQKIKIIGDVDLDVLRNIKGVLSVKQNAKEVIVKIESEEVAEEVFRYVSTCKNIKKYDVEMASLSEIFVAKVGKLDEKI
ncbi:MAG TPA: DUF4162 domain-containing protein, partial [Bacilli bacterium]|nr:DUF4162 domain-containing protein [Bacilli bacterium]